LTHKFLTRPGERWSPSGRYGLALTRVEAQALGAAEADAVHRRIVDSHCGPGHWDDEVFIEDRPHPTCPRYGEAALTPAQQAALTPAQQAALRSWQEPFAPAAAESWSPKAPLIDATAGGRFQGFRIP
jgi:hypothetical protein